MSMKVMIDAGHSSNISVGARGNGLEEEKVVLNIALKVGNLLKNNGIEVLYSRTNGNAMSGCKTNSEDLKARYTYANNNKVDYFVSIHNNSASSTSANGIETLYNTRYQNSKTLANNIQNQLVLDTGMRDRGLKLRTDLAVLNGTNMSACLVEVGFLSNTEDAKQLKQDTFINIVAEAITKGICKTYGIPYKNHVESVVDTELEKAIDNLDKKGISLNKDNWKSMDVIKLSNVPSLLSKFGGVKFLIQKGIIGNVKMWNDGTYEQKHVRALIIKCSNKL